MFWALQQAIFAALTGDAALMAVAKSVKDDVPQLGLPNAAFPYLVLGNDAATDWSTDEKTGAEVLVSIDAWSIYRGKKEVKQLAELVVAALDRADLTVAGANLASLDFNDLTFDKSDEGKTRRATIEFVAIIERV